jgi:hypothetical protein
MKATRGWTLALLILAACTGEITGPSGKMPDRALAAIPPTNNTACNKFWVGTTNGNWTDPARWNPTGVPDATSSVCINAAGTYTVTMPGASITGDTAFYPMLALDVGGAGSTPLLLTSGQHVVMNIGEGVVVQANAILRLNNSQSATINAAQTLTNLGSLESIGPCGGGCNKDHVINTDVINNGIILINGGNIRLPKTNGEYQNSGTLNVQNGTMLIPATAGNALFSQDAGVITGASNFNTFTIRSGTFSMNGGKVRSRNGATNLKPIVAIDGANLLFGAAATDSITIAVFGSSTASANITGNVPDLTTLWLAGPTDLNPGTTTFLDAAPVNNGKIRLGSIDGGQGALTIGGPGRLTNADSLYDVAISGGFTYHFAIEYTNNGTLTVHNTWSLEKAGGTYYNAGLITGSGTEQILGTTLVNTATGTVSPINTSGTPRFLVDGGRLTGIGTSGQITLANGGTVEPGLSPGILNARSLGMSPGTSLKIELGGTQPGIDYDQLNLASTQTFSAGGTVDLIEINGLLSGVCGQVFEILSWNSTNAGPSVAQVNGLTPAPTRALRLFTHTASLPRKSILYGHDPTQAISVAPNPVAIAEGGPGVPYAVCLDGTPILSSGQTVVVTPTPNAQITVSPPSLTFTSSNWQAPQFFTVTAVDDDVVEGNHTGSATHASTSGVAAYNGVTIASLTANITDNDVPPLTPTSTSVGSSANPSVFGQSVTFTATVTSGGGTPAGTVQFNVDGTDFGSPVALNASGQATIVHSSLAVGNHPVTATYSGNASFAGSNGALTSGQTVNQASSSTAVTSSLNPSNVGQSVTFTATVSSSGGTPAGTVQFAIDGVNNGAPVALVGGQASLTTSALGQGTHPVSATYSGNASFSGSNGLLAAGGQVVNLNGTSTSVGSSDNPSTFNQSVTFTATVSSSAGTPSGSVQFTVDGSPSGGPVALSGGQATLTTALLSVGNHTVSAAYAGNGTYSGSSGALGGGQDVGPAGTSTAVSSSANPSTTGQSVTFTATVTSGAGTPGGMVTFNIDGVDGSPIALNASGQAMFTTSALGVGNHPVLANYAGGGNFGSSGGALGGGQQVNPFVSTSTATAVTSSANPSTVGQSVTFTATVSSGAGIPTGTVQFFIDGNPASGSLTLNSGQATFATSALAQGTHPVSATYTPSGGFDGSSGALSGGQVVDYNTTSTGVSSSQNPSSFGQSVTFTATVSSSAGTPSGSVQFGVDGNPSGGPVALVNGQATLITSTLAVGNHGVSATYLGNATYATSGGALGDGQTVTQAGTSTTVGSSANPSIPGQNVTFTATVSSSGGVPAGNVQFTIDGGDVGLPVPVNASGQATYSTTTLALGSHTVVANYAGNASFSASAGALSGGQTVSAVPTTTTVASIVTDDPQYSDMVRLRATVTPSEIGADQLTGTVYFYVGTASVSCDPTPPAGAVGTDAIAATDDGIGEFDYQAAYIPGNHTVTACFYSTNALFGHSGDTEGLALGKEDATVAAGAANASAYAATGATPAASFTLTFTLREANPEPDANAGAHPGDIDWAGVTVHLLAVGTGSNNKTVACTPSATIGTTPAYSDVKTFTCTFSNVAVDAYEMNAEVTGNYYTGELVDALTVYDPNAEFATAGGKFRYPDSDDLVNFGLSVNLTGKGKSTARGNFIAIRHKANGDICRAKSNAIEVPAISGITASFTGKGNYVCTRPNGTTYDGAGNQTVYGWMQDNGEPGQWGTNPDRIWIRMTAPNSAVAMIVPASSNSEPLIGGNVKVPK